MYIISKKLKLEEDKMAKLGRPLKKNKMKITTLNVDLETSKLIRIEAIKLDIPLQELVTKILNDYLEEGENER